MEQAVYHRPRNKAEWYEAVARNRARLLVIVSGLLGLARLFFPNVYKLATTQSLKVSDRHLLCDPHHDAFQNVYWLQASVILYILRPAEEAAHLLEYILARLEWAGDLPSHSVDETRQIHSDDTPAALIARLFALQVRLENLPAQAGLLKQAWSATLRDKRIAFAVANSGFSYTATSHPDWPARFNGTVASTLPHTQRRNFLPP